MVKLPNWNLKASASAEATVAAYLTIKIRLRRLAPLEPHPHNEFHSSMEIGRPTMASTCRISIRTWGTDYSELVGMVWRCCPDTMNWWRVPENGPSNPRSRSLRMKSRRLTGCQPPMGDLVQVNPGEHRKFVAEF